MKSNLPIYSARLRATCVVLALALCVTALNSELSRAAEPEISPVSTSFDCEKSTKPIEKLICGDFILAKLDRQLSKFYNDALKSEPDDISIKENQRKWVAQLIRRCPVSNALWDPDVREPEEICVRNQYESRIDELKHIAREDDLIQSPQMEGSGNPYYGVYGFDFAKFRRWVAVANQQELICGLIQSTIMGNEPFARELLQDIVDKSGGLLGANLRADCGDSNPDNLTPYQIALSQNDAEMIALFQENGAGIDLAKSDALPPLILAVMSGNSDLVAQMIKISPNLDVQRKDHSPVIIRLRSELDMITPLEIAYRRGRIEIMKMLLDAGARADDREGNFLLREAAHDCNGPALKLLISHGADMHAVFDRRSSAETNLNEVKDFNTGTLCPSNTLPGVTDTQRYSNGAAAARYIATHRAPDIHRNEH